ncbi:type II toxin-antitoxin system VapC family toxin [Stenomitos frigidus]|uniref:VapC toxin family PIN domain ribonuclease n=1 Tax=Stenomitos frigidus ULC18 TaxID=2107698 RepID=A0A2T1DVL1_9CYAN|nr:type II toxin-antitoxin system VapC family toxin [Stenomitos frigidus]PSB24535.1 VapC toxin family PIN domain ribonuclease [Stenomitos frigidus ULC18]
MNGTDRRYLLDTNIFIYYFNGDPVVQPVVEDILTGKAAGFYCPVSWVELLCYPALTEAEAEQIRAFLRSLTCIALTESILDRTAQIRRADRTALPDALIAACALETTSTLVTRNTQDFQQINGLSIVNPFNP